MNETEWLTCTDPTPMLNVLRDKASERKLRLFGCACCRRLWELLSEERCRTAVDVAEKFADGVATEKERAKAYRQVPWKETVETEGDAVSYATVAAAGAVNTFHPPRRLTYPPAIYVGEVAENARFAMNAHAIEASGRDIPVYSDEWGKQSALSHEVVCQADLLRDIFGNPFRPVAFDHTWRTPKAVFHAQGIYDERAFDRLPLLADALEDAGCHNADLLTHCRQPGEHVRGCWVVDVLLEKT